MIFKIPIPKRILSPNTFFFNSARLPLCYQSKTALSALHALMLNRLSSAVQAYIIKNLTHFKNFQVPHLIAANT